MIDAKDLRIGNWVNREYWNPHPTEPSIELDSCFIYSIQSDRVSVRISDKKVIARIPREKLQPIPLTPEILEKCGFEYIFPDEHRLEIGNFIFSIDEDEFQISVKQLDSCLRWIHLSNPKYLHQLQNLYYALTGEELQYTP